MRFLCMRVVLLGMMFIVSVWLFVFQLVNRSLHSPTGGPAVVNHIRADVLHNKLLAPSTNHLRLGLKNRMDIRPGQSVGVVLPDGSNRLYSAASIIDVKNHVHAQMIELCVKRVANGLGSNYLCNSILNQSHRIFGPVGDQLVLSHPYPPALIFVATGTGIAPIRAILQELKESKYNGEIVFFYGCQNQECFLFSEEFKEERGLKLFVAFSRQGEKQYVQDIMESEVDMIRELVSNQMATVVVCGSTSMGKNVTQFFKKHFDFKILRKQKRFKIEVY